MPLQSALSARKTTRELDSRPLPPQLLGDLLWSAFGINRTNSGHRTAPSAMNSQEIEMYVALAEGLYRYDAPTHRLLGVAKGDFRGKVSAAEYSAKAAAVLIYVAELPKLAKARPELRPFYAGIDTGCIVQNVYLYCASAGLGTVVFDLDRPPLAKAMGLAEGQEVIMAQGVGGAR
jgi:SagB-type dehydrogenase family enzyme